MIADTQLDPIYQFTKVMHGANTIEPCSYDRDGNRLHYYRARYYDPNIGRFVSEDPIRFNGGISFFKYVSNLPTTEADPSGNLQISTFISYRQQSAIEAFMFNAGQTSPHVGWATDCVCAGNGKYKARIRLIFSYDVVYHSQSTKEHELKHIQFASNFWSSKWDKYEALERLFGSKEDCESYGRQLRDPNGWFSSMLHADYNEMDSRQSTVDDPLQRIMHWLGM